MTTVQLISNARRLQSSPLATATAIELVTGECYDALCCWCVEKVDPSGDRSAERVGPGDCTGCHVTGRDVLLVGPRT